MLLVIFVTACNCPDKKDNENTKESTNIQNVEKKALKFVKINGKDTLNLSLNFDNTSKLLKFDLNGEFCELKQDTTASGIQYSNEHYTYTEHQGHILLMSDDKIIFEHKPE